MGSIKCVQGQAEGSKEPLILVPVSEGIPRDMLGGFGVRGSRGDLPDLYLALAWEQLISLFSGEMREFLLAVRIIPDILDHTLFPFLFPVSTPPDLNKLLNYSLCPLDYPCLPPLVKDMWYWSIVNIPLKVDGQPAVIHELGSEYHNGDYNSAQGPLLLEDNNRRLRLPTTREEISKP